MICPFEIDIDRLAQASAGQGTSRSPVRGRWDTAETRVLGVVLPAGENPATVSKLRKAVAEMVWRNLDLQFAEGESVGGGHPS